MHFKVFFVKSGAVVGDSTRDDEGLLILVVQACVVYPLPSAAHGMRRSLPEIPRLLNPQIQDWCKQEWCYVDPCECDLDCCGRRGRMRRSERTVVA